MFKFKTGLIRLLNFSLFVFVILVISFAITVFENSVADKWISTAALAVILIASIIAIRLSKYWKDIKRYLGW